ncbi:MAG: hypothetical protein D6757_10300, partial [Alphaproteobacteria bacterium]
MPDDPRLPDRIPDDADWLVVPRTFPVPPSKDGMAGEEGGAGDPLVLADRLDLVLRSANRRLAALSIASSDIDAFIAGLPDRPARRLRAALARFAMASRVLVLADGRQLD